MATLKVATWIARLVPTASAVCASLSCREATPATTSIQMSASEGIAATQRVSVPDAILSTRCRMGSLRVMVAFASLHTSMREVANVLLRPLSTAVVGSVPLQQIVFAAMVRLVSVAASAGGMELEHQDIASSLFLTASVPLSWPSGNEAHGFVITIGLRSDVQ